MSRLLKYWSCIQRQMSASAISPKIKESEIPFEHARPYAEMPGPRPAPFLGNTWRFIPYIGKSFVLK